MNIEIKTKFQRFFESLPNLMFRGDFYILTLQKEVAGQAPAVNEMRCI